LQKTKKAIKVKKMIMAKHRIIFLTFIRENIEKTVQKVKYDVHGLD
jgi:hypothetical protein